MRIGVLILATLLLGQAGPPGGKGRPDRNLVYGAGTSTCRAYLKNINNSDWRNIYNAWIGGFVSGAGSALGAAESSLPAKPHVRRTDASAMAAYIDDYCARNPDQDVSDGAVSLIVGLTTPGRGAKTP